MLGAHALLLAAFQAMGGRDRLERIHAVTDTAVGTRAMVEQSERPAGPYFVDHYRFTESIDLDGGEVRTERQDWGYAGPQWWLEQSNPSGTLTVVDRAVAGRYVGETWNYAGGSPVQLAQERVALGPERVLFTADSSADVRARDDVFFDGVPYHVVAFTWAGTPCTLTLNALTNLPWSISWTRPYPYSVFYNPWGDVPTTVTFNSWSLEPDGTHYPREWTYERLGLPDQQLAVIALRFNRIDPATLTLPDALVAAHRGGLPTIDDLAFPGSGAKELVPGVVLVAGRWNVGFVRQDDGVVVLEAPISAAYTKAALAFAREHFGTPVKAVITTSDSWPHVGGVREAVAQGVPVYALDLNRPILERLLSAPHRMRPDDLERAPRKADFHWVSEPLDLGSGPNRLRIVPYRTATGERQMMVYFPESHVLYTSDLFAPDDVVADGTVRSWFTPQYLDEAIAAIDREKLAPQTIWGMHYGPTPYAQIVTARNDFLQSALP
jgi:glyoxylase-like metal-dependent hydrolase (beta-lactamase superfamily II)